MKQKKGIALAIKFVAEIKKLIPFGFPLFLFPLCHLPKQANLVYLSVQRS